MEHRRRIYRPRQPAVPSTTVDGQINFRVERESPKCDFCSKEYVSMTNLKIHLQKVHKVDEQAIPRLLSAFYPNLQVKKLVR
jgi:hypothetical protein